MPILCLSLRWIIGAGRSGYDPVLSCRGPMAGEPRPRLPARIDAAEPILTFKPRTFPGCCPDSA